MSAHVLLNLLNELRKRDKMQGASHFSSFLQRFSFFYLLFISLLQRV